MARQDWQLEAACRSIAEGGTLTVAESDSIFFLSPGKKANRAKAFCGACPVRRACLNYALLYNEEGIWGGMTDDERERVRPMVVDMLENQARNAGRLESRNIADFIPTQRTSLENVLSLVESSEYQKALDEAQELLMLSELLLDLPEAL